MKTSLYNRYRTRCRGMTLVELLVVMSIMVMLVAVSIPVFKPMLESQRTAGAARIVAGALQRTRIKAMQEQRMYGLEFIRFETAQNVSLQLRLLRESLPFVTPEDMRVVVDNGTIRVCQWNAGTRKWDEVAPPPAVWTDNVKTDAQIQFGRQGRSYELASATSLKSPYAGLNLPDQDNSAPAPASFDWALEATVSRLPQASDMVAAMVPQIVLPRGTIVDLHYSGTASTSFGGGRIAVMFSPAGHVEEIMGVSGVSQPEVLYFCVGEWERQWLTGGDTYAEDGRDNLQTPSNFWVTVSPRTGQVRITEFANGTTLGDVRKLATENALNVGGF